MQGYNLLKTEQISMCFILRSVPAFCAYLSCGISIYNITFFLVFLSLHLESTFKIKTENMGYYYGVIVFSYVLSALISPKVFEKVPRKL
jgi:hypothetical protein